MTTSVNAPLYVCAHDIVVALARMRFHTTPAGCAALEAAIKLLHSVSLALTFPGDRPAALHEADRALVKVRVMARVGVDLGDLTPGAMESLAKDLDTIGRMLGGWKRHHRRGGRLNGAPTA